MGIILSEQTRVLVQGITGRSGSRATESMLAYGTKVTCGVTPGKAGLTIHGLPVFDSVAEARGFDPLLNTSVIYVPPLLVYDAAMEAMRNGIATLVIVTENVPIQDTAKLIEFAQLKGCNIIGPSSIGVITPGIAKLGSVGGPQDLAVYTPGPIGVISKSGGMCAETASILSQQGLGQSTVIGIGGDMLIGTTFVDLLLQFEHDATTKAIVLFGEIGGSYEEQVAEVVSSGKITKPVIAFISGQFAEHIPRSLALGHAGAIIEDGKATAAMKKEALRKAGVRVANYHDDIPQLVKSALEVTHGI